MLAEEIQRPRVGVGVIIIRNDFVLMGKRKNSHGDGTWNFPGGHLELNETFAACARREVKEETGLVITKLMQGPYSNDIFTAEKKHYITIFVIAHSQKGKPKVLEPDKCEEWQWFKWHELPEPLFLPTANLKKLDFSPFRWSGFPLEK